MLLRAKENEVVHLKKEISCLQSEIQSLKGMFHNLNYYAIKLVKPVECHSLY